jgi:hypothetical protein
MFVNHLRVRPAPLRLRAAKAMQRAGYSVAAICAAWLICACTGLQGPPSTDNAGNTGQPVIAPLVGVKRTPVTSRDILLEWGTLSPERPPYKRKKAMRPPPLDDTLAAPEYSMTIEEIMANAACRSCDERPYHEMVASASQRHGVPASLIHAVIQRESAYNPAATSKRRARGLMQVTPETARFVGVRGSRNLYDPQTNINAGTAYLKYLLDNHGTMEEVLAAYNAGPGNVRKYKGVPPFRETRRYVRDVKQLYSTTAR